MDQKGLDFIYKAISKSTIREVVIKTNRGTELKMVRSQAEIAKNSARSLPVTIKEEEKSDFKETVFDICSPQVGFFNRYNTRTKKQYLKLRDTVQKGMVVGTIVSMHNHHSIIADRSGKVVNFLVEQDQPVSFNQPLIRLLPLE